jgi:DNA-binding transcriptional MerR regulator
MAKSAAHVSSRAAAISAQEAVDAHSSDDTSDLLGIAPLCEQLGITARALRLYEDKGLLQPKRINGARVYNKRDRARLTLILRAKALGSSLVDIKQYLDMYGAHGEGRAKQLDFVLKRTDAAIAELEDKRTQIEATLAEIRLINASVRQRLLRS